MVPSEKIVEIVVAFVTLSYFSVREIYQMRFTRAIELESQEHLDDEEGLAAYVADAIVVPLHLVACCLGKRDEFEDWSEKDIREPIRYDALTFLGLSRAWRYDYWNWIDLATIGCRGLPLRAAMPGGRLESRPSRRHFDADVGPLLLVPQEHAARLGQVRAHVRGYRVGSPLLLILFPCPCLCENQRQAHSPMRAPRKSEMFASAFYLYLGPRKSDEFGFHDDGYCAQRVWVLSQYDIQFDITGLCRRI